MSERRRSISQPARLSGVGIHTGARTTLTFHPAEPESGVVFRRTDLPEQPRIAARAQSVSAVDRRTSLGSSEAVVHTVEHVLAAVLAHEIDDLLVDLDGPEPPSGDGSAASYFEALDHAGVTETGGTVRWYTVPAPFVLREGEATYLVAPHEGLRITVTVEWDHPLIGRQSGCYDITPERFARELAPARTFGFVHEAEELRRGGLGRGASESNAIVLSENGVVGTELRWPDEFVRHKAVDVLGDLALLGGRLRADVVALRPSHRGNIALARAIEQRTILGVPPIKGIEELLGALPHRYPMLLVDRIVELEPGKRIMGLKNVTINEPFFQGHFPGHPIMPGVLIVEAMAQTGGVLLMGEVENPEAKIVYFLSIDGVKFRRPVVPGDQLRLELELVHFKGRNCRMRGVAYVEGHVVAEAEMAARIVDR